jgi:hypothetical protein
MHSGRNVTPSAFLKKKKKKGTRPAPDIQVAVCHRRLPGKKK